MNTKHGLPKREPGWVSDNYQPIIDNQVIRYFRIKIIQLRQIYRWKNFSDVDTRLCYDANIF